MRLFGFNIERAKNGDTVQSEPTPTEAGQPLPPAPSYGTEADLCELVQQRSRQAEQHQRVAVREWVLAVAMYEDRQWLAWDETAHQAVSLMRDDEVDKYVTHNLVRPLIDKMIGLATMSKPDASAAPQSDSDLDRAAAAEARAITAHLWRLHDRPLQMLDATWWATVCGLVYLQEYWDPNGMATVAVPGPGGQIAKKIEAKVGEVCSDIVPPFGVLIDPRARRWKQARWIVHREVLETAVIQERFGVVVEPDSGAAGNWFDSYLPDGARFGGVSSLGPTDRSSDIKRGAQIFTMYERPTPAFPEGRTIVCTKDRLIYAGPMPLTDKQQFPFARLVYQEAAAHAYGLGVMRSLAPLQVGLNRLLTKAVNHIDSAKDIWLDPMGSGVGADALEDDVEEKRSFRRVRWDPTAEAAPSWQIAPPLTGDVWRMVDLVWLHMQHIAGIHDVNQGGVPSGVTAGVSIELLQQGDRTQLGLFTTRIEDFAVQRDSIDIALYSQFAANSLPRMMGLDDTGNPQTAQTQVMAFRALTSGGSVAVVVQPGSATPKSPAGKTQEILEWFKMGLFDPTNPAAETVIRLLSIPKSDEILDAMQQQRAAMMQAMQANQPPPPPDPADLEQVRQQGATQRLQMQHQADGQQLALEVQAEVSKAQQEAATQQQLEAQRAQLQMAVAVHKSNLDAQTAVVKTAAQHQADTHQQVMQTALQIAAARHMPQPTASPKFRKAS